MLGRNRRYRVVRIHNAFPQAAEVMIDDGPPVHVNATVQLAEGRHHVQIAGPARRRGEFRKLGKKVMGLPGSQVYSAIR